ncbi:MAG: MATE family efflux transporter [Pseudomonadota bacterium]|nr:MATE family efflux transporter [Pseudomonadota bacterium]
MFTAATDRQILKIALPLIFSNLSVPLVGFVDNAVLGHLSSPVFLASAGLGAIIMSYILFSFGFIKSTTTGFISQINHLDHLKSVRSIYQIFIITAFISILLLSFKDFLIVYSLNIMGEAGVINSNAYIYLDIRFWSIPAVFIRDIFIGYLIGIKKVSYAMRIIISINLLNIILDYLFVFVLSMNIDGVAYASLIAESSIYVYVVYFLVKNNEFLNKPIFIESFQKLSNLKNKLIVNGNMFIRSIILMTCFASFMSLSANYGEIVLAANTILLNFFFIFSYGIDAFAHASEVLIGNSVGEKNPSKYDQVVKSSFKFIYSILISFLIIFLFFSTNIISLITNHSDVITVVSENIIFLFLVVIFGSIAFCIDGILIGALQHTKMRNIMILSGLSYALSIFLIGQETYITIWYAFIIFFSTRSILLFLSLKGTRKSLFGLKNYV